MRLHLGELVIARRSKTSNYGSAYWLLVMYWLLFLLLCLSFGFWRVVKLAVTGCLVAVSLVLLLSCVVML